jgi:hypothetical protein
MHRIKKTADIEIFAVIKKVSFMGKLYYLLVYPQGNFLFTESEFKKLKTEKFGENTHKITVPYSIRDKGYYRNIHFMDEHPTFVKKISELKLW